MSRERLTTFDERFVRGHRIRHSLPNGQSSHVLTSIYQRQIENAGGIDNFAIIWCCDNHCSPRNNHLSLKRSNGQTRNPATVTIEDLIDPTVGAKIAYRQLRNIYPQSKPKKT